MITVLTNSNNDVYTTTSNCLPCKSPPPQLTRDNRHIMTGHYSPHSVGIVGSMVLLPVDSVTEKLLQSVRHVKSVDTVCW